MPDGIGIEDGNGPARPARSARSRSPTSGITGAGKAIDIDQGGTLSAELHQHRLDRLQHRGHPARRHRGLARSAARSRSPAPPASPTPTPPASRCSTPRPARASTSALTTVTDNAIGSGHNGNGIDLVDRHRQHQQLFSFGSLAVTTDGGFGLKASGRRAQHHHVHLGGTNSINATGGAAVDLTNTSLGSGATFSHGVVDRQSPTASSIVSPTTGSFTANGGTLSGHTGTEHQSHRRQQRHHLRRHHQRRHRPVGTRSPTRPAAPRRSPASINDGNDAGGGIVVSGNTGGTINFTGADQTLNTGAPARRQSDQQHRRDDQLQHSGGNGLDITTTTGTGFNATGGGTVSVQGLRQHASIRRTPPRSTSPTRRSARATSLPEHLVRQ